VTRLGPISAGGIGVAIDLTNTTGSSVPGSNAPVIRLSSVTAGIGIRWLYAGGSRVPEYSDTGQIDLGGAMQTTGTGIYLFQYAGPISVSGTGSITAGANGVHMVTGFWRNGSSLVVEGLSSISAPNGTAVLIGNFGALTVQSIGSISAGQTGISSRDTTFVQGVGPISGGVRGIDILARGTVVSDTTVNIGQTARNGAISGGVDGIRSESKGNFVLFANANILGTTGYGVLQLSDASGYVDLSGGTVSGAVAGLSLTNRTTSFYQFGASVSISGATGLAVTNTGLGMASVANLGTIATTQAVG
jgi:hypothetical protein